MKKTSLIFDVYVTDTPLFPNQDYDNFSRSLLDKSNNASYKYASRGDITLYTLYSYSHLSFENIYIFIEFDEDIKSSQYISEIKKIYPNAHIINKRNSCPKDYYDLLQILSTDKSEYYFYSPNNDHPYISNSVDNLSDYENILCDLKNSFENITLIYSHFHETNYSFSSKLSWLKQRQFPNSKIIEKNDKYDLVFLPDGYSVGMQIVSRDLFINWCKLAANLPGDKVIKRFDELAGFVELPSQFSLVPKVELCKHYDAYYHTMFSDSAFGCLHIQPTKVPPMFIPNGFFERKIKIKYGYDQYFAGYTNINPSADSYIFEDFSQSNSKIYTDLKIELDSIPFFWKQHIDDINVNPEYVINEINQKSNNLDMINPWHDKILHDTLFLFFLNMLIRYYTKLKSVIKKIIKYEK
tara:strand:+ start:1565 stop:2794 length:1230 start_codon:yes stop_codon:yes gene_type:complete